MKDLTYIQRISIMRILMDIVLADGIIDYREKNLFDDIAKSFGLDETSRGDIDSLNSLIALTHIHDLTQSQKEEFARLMGRVITVDEEVDYNEVKIYNVVNEFCNINIDFNPDKYPEYTASDPLDTEA